jgi:hypothetical protein
MVESEKSASAIFSLSFFDGGNGEGMGVNGELMG